MVEHTEEESNELIRRAHRARRLRLLTEFLFFLSIALMLAGFGVAHLVGIQGSLHHPGILAGVVGIGGALITGLCWSAKSPHWLVDEVLGRSVDPELRRDRK